MEKDERDGKIVREYGMEVFATEAKPENASADEALAHVQKLLKIKDQQYRKLVHETDDKIASLQEELNRFVRSRNESVQKERIVVIRVIQRIMSLYDIESVDL